ncbi:Ig-like domain-containing protein [Corallococcus sicarius]|uniref:Ig-like domain-containing protein n=1 Tax=Corallococcus sicarius TaxID=2316726 RepID=UPI001ABFC54C|nr:Ig-like domain-containing protein [Corallococcus sicarius]
MAVVTMGSALLTGCDGVVEPRLERDPAPGGSASVASTHQALLSPELEASLACVQGYAEAGTCDWAHWSELWETCETYEHPELEDGLFIAEVQAGRCTSANWTSLREQLVAPRPPSVRVRVNCLADSQVLQEATLDGCYAVTGAQASYFDVPMGTTVTLHAGVDCTGDSTDIDSDTNLCDTSFASGASANDKVRSFRIQSSARRAVPYRYDCADNEPTCVKNFNGRLNQVNKTHTVKVIRVVMDGRVTPSLSEIRGNIREMYDFFDGASHHQVGMRFYPDQTVNVPTTRDCGKAKSQALKKSSSNAQLNVLMMPLGLCEESHGGGRRITLASRLQRDYAHETGHSLGLGHGNKVDANGVFDSSGDPSTYMGTLPSESYNLPQLHWLGWTRKHDLIKINAAIEDGGSTDLTLRPVNRNVDIGSSVALGAVYERSDLGRRLFVAMPKSRTTDVNQIDGGEVFVYRAGMCVGCTGISMGSTVAARIPVKPQQASEPVKGFIADDLYLKQVGVESQPVTENGITVEVFTSVTLRIKRSVPKVLSPAHGSMTSNSLPTYSGRTEPGLTIKVLVDDVRVGIITATDEGTWSFTQPTALAPGLHTVSAKAEDSAGHVSPPSEPHTFTVDTTGN